MSTHNIPIIAIEKIITHPNADALEIAVVNGWECCVKKDSFKIGDKAIYIEPDYLVPVTRPEFAFLKTKEGQTQARIKVRKIRSVISQGLLIPVPEELKDCNVDDNVIERLGIERYEPPMERPGRTNDVICGYSTSGPSGIFVTKYDVENYNSYKNKVLEHFVNQEIVAHEKIHGANCRFVFSSKDEKFYLGSRTNWKLQDGGSTWDLATKKNPWVEEWCRNHPDMILCAEVFGNVQNLKYGAQQGDLFIAAFDIMHNGEWLDFDQYEEACGSSVVKAPLKYRGVFDEELLRKIAEEDSIWPGANHMSEGVVFKLTKGMAIHRVGRSQFKIVSNRYLSM